MHTNPILEEDLIDIHSRFAGRHHLSGSTLVLTGAGGFLGLYLSNYFCKYMSALGLNKIVLIDPAASEKTHWLNKLGQLEGVEVLDSKVQDLQLEKHVSRDERLYLIHAASIASPTFYRKYPLETIDANVWGLRTLLESCRNLNLSGFLFFSSSEIYGDPDEDHIPTHEDYRGNVSCLGPRACYDESKRFGETICWVYSNQFNLPITIVRPFNNFGPGMSVGDKRLPADLALRVMNGEDITIFSNGAPRRTFCYVSDAVIGYLECLVLGKFDYFNIGGAGDELSVDEFAAIFKNEAHKLFGYNGDITYLDAPDSEYLEHNPQRRRPDLQKSKEILGFNPKISVAEGVSRYLKFLKHDLVLK